MVNEWWTNPLYTYGNGHKIFYKEFANKCLINDHYYKVLPNIYSYVTHNTFKEQSQSYDEKFPF